MNNQSGHLECSEALLVILKNRLLDGEVYRLPRPIPVTPPAQAFMVLPFSLSPSHTMACWQLYNWALAQAQAAARPSLLERDLLAVWN